MKYIAKIDGQQFEITEQEAMNVGAAGNKGLVFVPSLKGYINLSFTPFIMPADKVVQKDLTEGRLHDGTRVTKQFGVWKDATNPELYLDPKYYPEVAQDKVFSEVEFEKIKHLPTVERLQLVGGGEVKKISGGLTKIGV